MPDRFADHFSKFSSRYAQFRPRYPEALFDYLAEAAGGRTLAWDCAAGSGQATLELANRFDRVIATDASREQIASAPIHPNVEYRVALAEDSGLADASADLIVVAQALHWFDFDRFFAEARRVLVARGVLAIWCYGITRVEGEAVDPLVQTFYHQIVGPYWPRERGWVEEGYRSLPFPFAELEPPTFEMKADWLLEEFLGYVSTWSATNRYKTETGVDPLIGLTDQLAAVWGSSTTRRQITWPLSLRIGRKA